MKINLKYIGLLYLGLVLISLIKCTSNSEETTHGAVQMVNTVDSPDVANHHGVPRALLASRFDDMNALQEVVRIKYFQPEDSFGHHAVVLSYSDGGQVESILEQGVSQGDIVEVRDGDIQKALALIVNDPLAVTFRSELNQIYVLARRRDVYFGAGDVAFYDLAESSVASINTPDLAYLVQKDSSEKGYINTFNHITAQALITSCYGVDLAKFIADLHERHNMPELLTGNFTNEQLTDPNNNPMDNYVDMINNDLGQMLGLWLRDKHGISNETKWTAQLLADYLNDLQSYYSWSFGIGMAPYRADMELLNRFAQKINTVAAGDSPYSY